MYIMTRLGVVLGPDVLVAARLVREEEPLALANSPVVAYTLYMYLYISICIIYIYIYM